MLSFLLLWSFRAGRVRTGAASQAAVKAVVASVAKASSQPIALSGDRPALRAHRAVDS